MTIIHVSYRFVHPRCDDPWAWIRFLGFFSPILERQAKEAKVIAIYHIHYRGEIEHNGVHYHFPFFKRWQLRIPFALNRYIKRLRPDVVIVHGLIFPFQVLMLRWQLGRHPILIAQHHSEPPFSDARKYLQRLTDRYIRAYFFASRELGMLWVRGGQINDAGKIKEIMGTSSPFYQMARNDARAKTGVLGEKVFLWVGRLDANKDPLLVGRAFSRFADSTPGAMLYMIFQTVELLEKLKISVKRNALSKESIHLVGRVAHDELLYWYNSADYIVSSSHYEGAGIAVCEAMSCGCIPILTNIPSFRMMTDHGRIGVLYEAGDEDGLVSALQSSLTLKTDSEKRKVLERFDSELSFEANVRKITSVINEIDTQL